jgi:glutamate-1-semialdehyde 2,1-aminomutase
MRRVTLAKGAPELVQVRSSTERLIAEYRHRTPTSKHLNERLRRYLPAGETRRASHYYPYPIELAGGYGSRLDDFDGNQFIDLLNNYTVLVHGNNFRPIRDAVSLAIERFPLSPAPHEPLLQLSEMIGDRYPAVKALRFTSTGTEAALLATRLVRRFTGRSRILVFRDAYHGAVPEFLDADANDQLRFNDVDMLVRSVDDSVAAVFVEPFLGAGGVVPADEGFLATIRRQTQQMGALMVLDEVQSLRNAYHGVHGALGLRPDLILMGKIIGGGLPVGAVGGGSELISLASAEEPEGLQHSGTFNGNVMSMAAGAVCLSHLTPAAVDRLNAGAVWLADALRSKARLAGVPAAVTISGSIMQVHLPGLPAAAKPAHLAPDRALHLALLLGGVYAAPRGMLNLSTAISGEDLTAVAEVYGAAFARLPEWFEFDA